jgi:hypothetical protein
MSTVVDLSRLITGGRWMEWTPEKQLQILPLRVRMTAFVMGMTTVGAKKSGPWSKRASGLPKKLEFLGQNRPGVKRLRKKGRFGVESGKSIPQGLKAPLILLSLRTG